ncbi:MAG: biotin--[acetyl-CoA-carboxylase] ligase, partial [Desulfuromonadales bacterium]|nr:biotin--[acetyl-CoA-carboxylase] ligase [Desulfuromonadales bacterium]NIS40567.1 biotin--[acetyl-CoA-carboxylase] ligase [Desulfuromonadales bacterium]
GYRLQTTPDTLISSEVSAGLDTDVVGRNIVFLPETDSTNTQARQLAEEGAEDGTVVIADRQSRGKGRMGRFW